MSWVTKVQKSTVEVFIENKFSFSHLSSINQYIAFYILWKNYGSDKGFPKF